MFKDNSRKYFCIGLILFIIIVLLYALALMFISRFWCLNIKEIVADCSSFLGGMIGGIGTMIAVYVTTSQTRDYQNENYRISYNQNLIRMLSEYIAVINEYIYLNSYSNRTFSEIGEINYSIENPLNLTPLDMEGTIFKEASIEEKKKIKSLLQNRLEMYNTMLLENRKDENQKYNYLCIYLNLQKSTNIIISCIENVHKSYLNGDGINGENILNNRIDELKHAAERFCIPS